MDVPHALLSLPALRSSSNFCFSCPPPTHPPTHPACLAAAEYGTIKLVAAMMNSCQHWFAGEQAAAAAATGSPFKSEHSRQRSSAEENTAANGCAAEPAAKRQCMSFAAPSRPQQGQQPACTPARLDRGAVFGWIAAQGACTGPQLLARFDGSSGDVRQPLAALLASLCCDFVVARRGGASASSSLIDLDDPATQFFAV